MPFRVNLYLRLFTPNLFALCALNLVDGSWIAARMVGRYTLIAILVLAAGGVLTALVFLFTGVHFRCPFCGRYGPGAIEHNGLPWMECKECGTIRCEGFLGLRIVRETPPEK